MCLTAERNATLFALQDLCNQNSTLNNQLTNTVILSASVGQRVSERLNTGWSQIPISEHHKF